MTEAGSAIGRVSRITNWKRILLVAGLGGLVLTTSVVIYFWRPISESYDLLLNDPFDDRPFDQVAWLAMRGSWDAEENPRGRMVVSLRARLIDSQLSQREVLELLGAPEFENRDGFLSYNLGMWTGFRIDYDSLDIHFGDDGRVSEVLVVQH